jgi:hypothetical protein
MTEHTPQSGPARRGLIYRLPVWDSSDDPPSDAEARSRPQGLVFLDASVALRVVELSCPIHLVTVCVPPVGVALAEGRVVTVLVLSHSAGPRLPASDADDEGFPGSDRAVMCEPGPEQVAVWGGRVVTTGVFDVAGPGSVIWRNEAVPELDVSALYARAEAAIWAARATPKEQEGPQ